MAEPPIVRMKSRLFMPGFSLPCRNALESGFTGNPRGKLVPDAADFEWHDESHGSNRAPVLDRPRQVGRFAQEVLQFRNDQQAAQPRVYRQAGRCEERQIVLARAL